MDLVTEYQNAVRGYLERLTGRFTAELKPIAEADFGSEAFLLQFEVEMQDFTRGFPIYWFALDEDGGDIDTGWATNRFLGDIPYTVPAEVVDSEAYADEVDAWAIGYQMLIAWASECWRAAGGRKCRYPAYIGHHDTTHYNDLNTLKEISDDERWGRETYDPLPPVPEADETEFPRRKSPRKYEEQVDRVFQHSDLEALEQLIASGWDVNYGPYRADISALEFAVIGNNLELARALLRHGAGLGLGLPLAERSHAITGSRGEMIKLLKEYQKS